MRKATTSKLALSTRVSMAQTFLDAKDVFGPPFCPIDGRRVHH